MEKEQDTIKFLEIESTIVWIKKFLVELKFNDELNSQGKKSKIWKLE